MYGARCGLAHVWHDNLDPNLISDYDWLAERWLNCPTDCDVETLLGMEMPILTPTQSRWFKTIWHNPERHGLMIPEP